MSVSAAIRRMLAAGLTIEQALIAAESFEAEAVTAAPQLTKRQARNKRYYNKKKASESSLNSDDQDVSDDQDASPSLSSPEGSSPTPPSPNPLQSIPPSPPKGGSSPTARQALAAVLDADHVDAVVDHRQKIRKPLTAHAAKLLAGKFGRCPDPNAAADVMIANGWQGFEPEWLDRRQHPQAQSQAPPMTAHQQRHQAAIDAFDRRLGVKRDDDFTGNTLDLERSDFGRH